MSDEISRLREENLQLLRENNKLLREEVERLRQIVDSGAKGEVGESLAKLEYSLGSKKSAR